MKHHLIMSSLFTEGKEMAHGRDILQAINQKLNNVTVSESDGPGHAEELARTALRNGAESILVAASDATINEVVNGFFENDEPVAERPHLGIIPTTVEGDFCRTAGMPDELVEAVGRIGQNTPKPLDLGKLTTADGKSRYFANVASTGISSGLGKKRKKFQWLKEIDGDLAFNWSVIKNGIQQKRFPLSVSIPGGPQGIKWDANCVAVCNGNTFGGGVTVAQDADYSDGFLDVIVIHDYSKVEFLESVKCLRENRNADLEGISKIRTTSVLLACDDPDRRIPIDADGEFAGELPARFEVVPSAAMLF